MLLDATSGDILAMVSLPDHDPNFAKDSPSSSHRNRSISDAYEPGSAFKSFILAALMNERAVPPKKKFICPAITREKPEGFPVRKHGQQNL